MRLRPDQLAEVRAKVLASERSRAFRAHEEALDWVAVCLIGYAERVPRKFHDNHGAQPVRVTITRNPKKAADRPDIESPLWEITVLDFVWVQTEAHAKRLKAKLDTLLLGTSQDNRALRHGWRDLEAEPEIVWPVLLAEAVRLIRQREAFEVFNEEQRLEKVSARLRGRVR